MKKNQFTKISINRRILYRFLILIILGLFCLIQTNAQWLAGYNYRKKLTIDHTQVMGTTDLTNFPFLIQITHDDFRTTGNGGGVQNSNGYDIAFTSDDGISPLDHDLDRYVSTSGEIIFWVRIPTLSVSTNTELYIYYGNSSVSTNQSVTSTWKSDYVAVWHLTTTNDATANVNHGVARYGAATTAGGNIGNAFNFDGIDDLIRVNEDDNTLDLTTNFTLSAWAYPTAIDNYDRIIAKTHTAKEEPFVMYGLTLNDAAAHSARFVFSQDTVRKYIDGTSEVVLNDWTYISATYDGTTRKLYINGQEEISDATVTGPINQNDMLLSIACARYGMSDHENYFQGMLDEIRIATNVLSAGWIETEYNNQSNPIGFSTFAPVFTSTPVTSTNEDALYTYNITTYDDNGDILFITAPTLPFWLTFTDNGNGTASLSGTPTNAEVGNHSVVLNVSDGIADTSQSFTITVQNTNDAPTDIALSNNTVSENAASGTAVGNLSTTDPDAGDSHTCTLVAGAGSTDNASFAIMGNELRTNAVFNYETQNSFSIRIRTTDAGGLFYEEVFTITVVNVNEIPSDIALSNNTVSENAASGTAVGNLSTTDPDAGDSHTYTLVAGAGSADNASFTIVGNELRTNAVFNYELQNSFSIRVRTTDAGGLFYEEVFTISVLNINEVPSDIALSNNTVSENAASGTATGNLSTTDPDAGDSHTYTLVAGAGSADNASFTIVGTELRTATVFDFDIQNIFSIRIRTTDAGGLFYEEVFIINVLDENSAPTDIALSNSSIDENQLANSILGMFSTTDSDASDIHTYVLVTGTGDTDNTSFQIAGNELQTNAVFNYELQNTYNIRVRTTDNGTGNLFYEEIFTITIVDINDDPGFTSTPVSSAIENILYSYAISTSDPDAGDILTITATGLPSWLDLTDNGDGKAILDGTPGSSEVGDHTIILNVNDGTTIIQQSYTLTVLNNYIAPIALQDNMSMYEDEQESINVLLNDQNPGNESLVLSIAGQASYHGTAILSNNGDLLYTPDANYNGPDSIFYSVCIEGAPNYCDTAMVLIAVEPVNDAPIASDQIIDIYAYGIVNICIPVTDIDSDESTLAEIIGSNSIINSTWSYNQVCFGYEINPESLNQQEIQCVVCDNGSPVLCDTVSITMNYQIEDLLQIAEGISPNGDNINDIWMMAGIENYPVNKVKIYTRWGNLIYETENYDNTINFWDGTMNRGISAGKKVSCGTYFYILEIDGINLVKSGYVVVN